MKLWKVLTTISLAAFLLIVGIEIAKGAEAGRVRFRIDARSYADSIPIEWFRTHVQRVLGYPTAGDRYPKAGLETLAYHDAYTTWGTNGLNPTHRAEYVKWVERDKEVGYRGSFMDDIEWHSGFHLAGSQAEVLALIEAVRTAIGPTGVLELNTQEGDLRPRLSEKDPFAEASLRVANQVDREFGVTQISSETAYAQFIAYATELRERFGVHIDITNATAGDEYSEASYFLINDGGDFLAGKPEPKTWWSGWEVGLGQEIPASEGGQIGHVGGLYWRVFPSGWVFVDAPGGSPATINLSQPMRKASGEVVTKVVLGAKQGVVLQF